jgi:hypothetical protein
MQGLLTLSKILIYVTPYIKVRRLMLSTMPNGEGNPYPILFAFLMAIALIYFLYLAADWLTWRMVRRMEEGHDIDGLIRALRSAWLACKAAHALGDMRDAKAVGPLIEALDDGSDDVRRAAAKALGDIGDGRAVEPLTRALDDRYRGVRECASYALQKIRKPCDPT